ncbi:MAG: FliA/WhiG family RNA polymerase sigma factor [Actinomycetota bacterium]|nr:FliA/WhiG family RNA polymerase sigma factor [Actinomycetota bacterium]
MKGRTLGDLWERYLCVRGRAWAEIRCPLERRKVEREERALRDRLVVNYSPLARYVAGRIPTRATGTLDREDVLSWGLYGLLGAVETYDPSRPVKFETYAISKIRWSILDELRKADPLPRSARLRTQKMERVRSELTQRYGRAPTEAEIANALGVSLTDHRAFLDRVARSKVGSLEAGCEVMEGGLHDLVADRFAADPGRAAERAEVRAVLGRAIEELGEQERVVTTFYYYEGLTLREIGGILGLTEGRISQILRAAMIRLRGSLSDAVYLLEGAPGDP